MVPIDEIFMCGRSENHDNADAEIVTDVKKFLLSIYSFTLSNGYVMNVITTPNTAQLGPVIPS